MNSHSILLLVCSAAASVASTLLLKISIQHKLAWTGSVKEFLIVFLKVALQPVFALAVVAFVASNLLWLLVLSSQKLSLAFPIQVGLVVVINTIVMGTFLTR